MHARRLDQTVTAANPNTVGTTTAKKTKAIVSLVLGIVSLLSFLIPLIGGAGIAAAIVGFIARRSEPAGARLAIVGIVLGIIGFVLGIVFFIVYQQQAMAILEQQGL